MAIGTMAAIGLGVAGIGSALGASSQSKAASKAADTSLAVAQQNNALARDIYGQNKGMLSPYVQRGNAAGDAINALLGLGGATPGTPVRPPVMRPNPGTRPGGRPGGVLNAAVMPYPGQNTTATATTAPTTPPAQTAQQAQAAAFDRFRNSTGYQFRLGEGMNALNSGLASSGVLQSGAAMLEAQRYGQNFASNEFGNYMGYLGNQQGVGLGGASALAGVGQNYVNTISANNNSAGSAAANAALVRGQNNPFANLMGTIGGGILGMG